MKTLIIAEKPSVGRDIARVMGCAQKGEGFLFSERYIVSWAIGHLITLCDPEDYDAGLKKWRAETLPIIPRDIKLKPLTKTRAQLNILKKLMTDKNVGEIICATDSGREGELIFRYIYMFVHSGTELPAGTELQGAKPVKRLWISSMTDEAIREGFAKLKNSSEYDLLYASAKCRSEADWLVGINATRAYTVRYGALLSVGRVQTPTLAIIVARQREINAFVPKDYWEVVADIRSQGSIFKGTWFKPGESDGTASKEGGDKFRTEIDSEQKAKAIADAVRGRDARIASAESKRVKEPPPLLYDLTELQRDCNKYFGFSAQKTLSIAQDLYEKKKLITYPRTDSRYLTSDMVSKLPDILKKIPLEQYEKYVSKILALPSLPITKRIADNSKVSDHHAIIPTGAKRALTPGDEYNVYDLIARRLIAVLMPPFIYDAKRVITLVENLEVPPPEGQYYFLTNCRTVVQEGWKELYRSEKQTDEDEPAIADIRANDTAFITDARSVKKKTQPPKPYNEASLLSAMENAGRFVEDEELKEKLKESGLGTPATRAAIIERLIEVGYISRKGKTLVPSEKGMTLIDIVPRELKSPETTGKWEKGLTSIAKGTMAPERFMQSIKRYVKFITSDAAASTAEAAFPKEAFRKRGAKGTGRKSQAENLGRCPKCGQGDVLENTKAFYCARWKSGCKFTLWKNSLKNYGLELTPEITRHLLKGESLEVDGHLPQTGEKFHARLRLAESVELIFQST
ncbi:MAG: DNA topoisomerase III [Clostridiales bacterium]|jgi:DNA topoisomerase-3|nr:DNA topoisomerase III [Clostridiales bacterium]